MDLQQLNFRHLFAFWKVTTEGRLTQAARALHVSQSTLSTQIQHLEERLGHPLFERRGRQMLLTATGRQVYRYAENIFGLGEEMLGWLDGHYEGMARVRIGGVSTMSRNYQENLFRPMMRDPTVVLTIESGTLDELVQRLLQHKLDLVLANSPVSSSPDQPLHSKFLGSQEISVVGQTAIWGRRKLRIPEDLDGQPVALPGARHALRAEFDALCSSANVNPQLRAEIDDMTMLRLVARDSGWLTILPAVVVQDELESGALTRVGQSDLLRERFYAITTQPSQHPAALDLILEAAVPAEMRTNA
ncbi:MULTISPECIES: LysR substrate-binding domain-containing protein [Rhodanobacter]|jgi:LysR family transcriptional activator of nhaA|uniref:LysR family transcriptional regulator, transcriptional activator of nhaA n=1 Tax=Rhodanobacter glycinis TaxID=582702 RepID=A0A1I4CBV0_9GAMM|nr:MULTISPECIES: LysR substrate-binding domain-containing protein [Rhodanobacter]EIM00101.1 LysR family transcriptional regulator [Rhodanobacter sp. 115]SFK77797.1 LysR family transcriptional regulator, transcriptional activator of nhaA [Rhodanobacter glycinis]